MRQVYALFGAADRFGDDRVNQPCERAVDAECTSTKIVVGMVERALEAETVAADPIPDNVIVGRFARDPRHFSAGGSHVALTITTIDNLVRDGCIDHAPADPPVGPTVDDLAAALSQLAPFEVTSPPSDVTVLGYQGKHLQLTVPDIPTANERGGREFIGCTGGKLRSWFSPIHDDNTQAFFGYNAEPGRTEDFWILDVSSTRLVLTTTTAPDSPAQDVAELGAIFDSLRIEP